MSAEDIVSQAGGSALAVRQPERATFFAQRAMRLRQRAAGHAMGDFLSFMADVAMAQQNQLLDLPSVPLPDAAALARAAQRDVVPVPAVDWPLDPAWRGVLRGLVDRLRPGAPAGVRPALDRLADADDVFLDRQADAVLHELSTGLDMACAPLVSAALQVMFVHLASAIPPPAPTGDPGSCPCCGSPPVASITRSDGGAIGQRYLHCAWCGTEWHLPRARCAHCQSDRALAYQSLDRVDGDGTGAAQAAVQAETCEDCGHYLKIMHTDRDPMVEPLADDLASLTLDLLVSDTGLVRHGRNPLLVFAEPPAESAASDGGGP